MRVVILLLSLFCASVFAALPFDGPRADEEFLPVDQAFVFDVQPQDGDATTLSWDIAPGYYLYRQRLKFIGLADAHAPELPMGLAHEDEYFGASQIYRERLQLSLPAEARGRIEVQWQGCADAGLCYPPQSRTLDLGGGGAINVAQADDLALLDGLQHITPPANLAQIDADLPLLVIGGSRDPVSDGKRLGDLAGALREAGVRDVQLKLYPEARHELLNESNRDEVTAHLIDWLQQALSHGRKPTQECS